MTTKHFTTVVDNLALQERNSDDTLVSRQISLWNQGIMKGAVLNLLSRISTFRTEHMVSGLHAWVLGYLPGWFTYNLQWYMGICWAIVKLQEKKLATTHIVQDFF